MSHVPRKGRSARGSLFLPGLRSGRMTSNLPDFTLSSHENYSRCVPARAHSPA